MEFHKISQELYVFQQKNHGIAHGLVVYLPNAVKKAHSLTLFYILLFNVLQ